MTHVDPSFFAQIALILAVSVALGLLSSRFRQSLIMGYILAGVVLGPYFLRLIRDYGEIKQIAEIGLLFLMFTIGLGFSLKKLKAMREMVFGAGALQVLVTVIAGALLARFFGFPLSTGIFIGCVMSLSSTAVVSKELTTHHELDSPQGRITLGILIFQDLAVIVMMVLLPLLKLGTAASAGSELFWAIGKAALFLIMIYSAGRFLFPTVLRFVMDIGGKELLILATMMLAFGTAAVGEYFGFSIVLGAFLAGVMLSETEFNFQIHQIIFPFREIFMSLFFVSIGLLLDPGFLFSHFWQVALLALAIPLVNVAVCLLVVLVFGYPLRVAIFSALILAGIGEFSFVLLQMGASHELISPEVYQLLLSLTAVTLLLTPFVYQVASRFSLQLEAVKFLSGSRAMITQEAQELLAEIKDHVIICGFGPVGQNLAYHLEKEKIPFVITEMNVQTVKRFAMKGFPIYFGDAASPHMLEKMGVEKARAIAMTMLDPSGLGSLVRESKRMNPKIFILARTRFVSEIGGLMALGVTDVISEEFETSKIFAEKLESFVSPPGR